MVNNTRLRSLPRLVGAYVALTLASLVALALVGSGSGSGSGQTTDAWVHEIIVAAFAVLLPLRLRAAGRGSDGARRAVGIIGVVLLLVNLVEAAIPGFLPPWMRIEMLVVAAIAAAIAVVALRPDPHLVPAARR